MPWWPRRADPFSFRPPGSLAAGIAVAASLTWWVPAASQRAVDAPMQTEIVDGREVAAGEVLVKFRGKLPPQALAALDATVSHPLPTGAYRVRSRSHATASLVASFKARGDVVYAEPNYVVHGGAVPNDPQLVNAWFLVNRSVPSADISAGEAWDITTGSPSYVVGVIDSGIDHRHVDLAANLWTAPSSYTINYRGGMLTCPAGSHGIDTVTGNCDAVDAHGHGTMMSGVIGAVGNNGLGTSGVNWRTSLMDLRFLGADNRGFISDAITAIDVALQLKAIFGAAANVRVLSNSWGADFGSQALQDAVARTTSADVLFVAAAMNDGRDVDVTPRYPAGYTFIPNVIAVAATTPSDELASFSNYGVQTVHLGAPGHTMLTTAPGNSYTYVSGTSPATAAVAGVAALLLSACPLDTAGLKNAILQSVDALPGLAGKTITGGRLNAYAALQRCAGGNQPPTVTITSPAAQTHFTAPATITIAADASDVDGHVTAVEFFANGARLGAALSAPFRFSWTNVPAGAYTLSAVATDNQGRTASAPAVGHIFVDPPGMPVPSPWASTDVGATGVTGSASYDGGVFTVRGGGADVWGTADAFHYVYQPLSGDGTIVARVASVEYVAPWTKSGVMIRGALTPSAAQAFMVVSAGRGFAFQRRTVDGSTSVSTSSGAGTAPRWVRLARTGQTITAAISDDGTSWTTVGQDTFAMAATVYVGVAVSSHTTTQLARATFDSVAVSAVPTSTLPAGWAHRDIGAVGPEGSAAENSGMFTIAGAGADIWLTADAFHYAYLQLTGDVTVVSRVTSVEGVHAWTKAGVMIRETLSPSSAHAMMIVSPGKGLAFQRRLATDGASSHTSGSAGVAPYWVRLARTGQTIVGSVSTDGVAWQEVGRDTFAMSASVYVGLAVSSHDPTRTATATFDHVSAVRNARLPSGWSAIDVGSVGPAGSTQESAGTFSVSGGGADIWGTEDAFHYAYMPLSGDGTIVARVDSVEYVAPWTKAGVMIRESLGPSSPQALMLVSPGKGLAFQRRVAAGGVSTSTRGALVTAPQWVKLVRAGQTISAWTSSDGAEWTFVGQDTFGMPANVYVGLAVSSHDATRLATATFSNVR